MSHSLESNLTLQHWINQIRNKETGLMILLSICLYFQVPSVPSRLLRNLNPPSVLLEQAAPVLARIQQVFPLEEVELRVSKRTGEKVFGAREEKEEEPATKMMKMDEEEEEVKATYVGSINPVQDFNYLLSHSVTTGASIEVTGEIIYYIRL